MISREETLNKAQQAKEINPEFTALSFGYVHAIYDSIGSCGECERFRVFTTDDGESEYCTWFDRCVEQDFFCADFKRKEND